MTKISKFNLHEYNTILLTLKYDYNKTIDGYFKNYNKTMSNLSLRSLVGI